GSAAVDKERRQPSRGADRRRDAAALARSVRNVRFPLCIARCAAVLDRASPVPEEVFACLGITADVDRPDGWALALSRLNEPVSLDLDRLTPASRECVETFLLLADEIAVWGLRPFGGYV